MSHLVLPLAACTPELGDTVGGKAVGLGALLSQNLPVPDGFAVTTAAYRATITTARDAIDAAIAADAAHNDAQTSATLRTLIETVDIPADVAAAIRDAYLKLDPSGESVVAVRSSATTEDLPDASFAGQQDTYLGIRGVDAVIAHVVRCWSSLFTPQAIAYRRRVGIGSDDLAMAVVVQRMVDAAAAGVMMTLDPVTGDRRSVFISAAHGLGEGVVKGDVESDSIWVDKKSLTVTRREEQIQRSAYLCTGPQYEVGVVTLTEAEGARPAISDAEAIELARVAIRMEDMQNVAQDLEWAIDVDADGRRTARLLQARPETVWSNRASPASAATSGLHGHTRPDTTWTTTNVGESVPGVPTPLGWSVWSVAGEIAMRSAFHAIGALSSQDLELPDRQEDWLLGIFYGRAALSVSLVCEWSERVPGIDPVAMAEQIFSARPRGYVARSQRRYYPRVAVKAVQPMLRVQSMVAADRHDAKAFRAMTLAELTTAGEARTRVLLDEAIELHRRCLSTQTLLTMAVCQPITDRLLRLAESVGVSGEELMAGYGGHDEIAAVDDMWAVCRGRLDFDAFLSRHGFHAWQEGELSARSWREDPTPVRDLIASYAARQDDADPGRAEAARMARRADLERQFLARLSPVRRPLGRLLLGLARTFVPLRGVAKGSFVQVLDVVRAAARKLGEHLAHTGVLADAEDVFYLTLPEIRSGSVAAVSALISTRRAERAAYEGMEIPPVFCGEPTPIVIAPAAMSDTIVGTGASPGVVEGRARVVTRPDQARVEDGEILVARDTDPSWATLMYLSSGLVADIGGVMSHTAIVARELSLPCVVNTGNASKTLKTGDLIRVNGTAGSIEVLKRAAEST
jgi:rifampicin phosphotransferase